MAREPIQTVREALAVFHDEASLDGAIDDLEEHGFDRAEISLMASERAVEQKLGTRYERIQDAADDPATPRAPPVAPEEVRTGEGVLIGGLAYVGAVAASGAVGAAGGALLPVVLAALAGVAGGGAVGSLLAKALGDRHAHEIQAQLDRGGLLLWVSLRDPAHEKTAVDVLSRHTTDVVRIHEIPAHDPAALEKPPTSYPVGLPFLFRRID